jgi:crossover junction endodeoxyribonuclease RuvC
MRILGIDPGLRLTGYAVIEPPPAPAPGGPARWGAPDASIIEAGVIRLSPRASVCERLGELDADLKDIIERCRPETMAVEKLYAHYAHPTTAIIMGHARGVVLLAARRAGLELVELGATEVKKSLTGHGHASKEQMQRGVQAQLGLPAAPQPADVADAIAIALCALRRAPGRAGV